MKADKDAKLTYKSDNKSVKVDKNGKVTIAKNFVGKATITVTATSGGAKTTQKVTITVNPKGTTFRAVYNGTGKEAEGLLEPEQPSRWLPAPVWHQQELHRLQDRDPQEQPSTPALSAPD